MTQNDIIFITVRINKLEVSSAGFAYSPKEIECIAPSLLIVLGLKIHKCLDYRLIISLFRVVEVNPEGPWLLSEKVRIVLDCDELTSGE
jgi:hypothetical protein